MKKIFFSGMIFISFFLVRCGFGADETVTTPGKALTIQEFIGKKDAYLEPTMFPKFYNYVDGGLGETSKCIDEWSEKDRWTPISTAGGIWAAYSNPYEDKTGESQKQFLNTDCSLKVGIYCNYSNCARAKRTCDSEGKCQDIYKPCKENGWDTDGVPNESTEDLDEGEYQAISGLSGNVQLYAGYRNITKVLFSWTVRLEASSRILAVFPYLCSPFHATVDEEFPAGPLKTQLYVKGTRYPSPFNDGYAPVGQIAEMTVPSSGKGGVRNIGDPTITGSYVLVPADFATERVPLSVDFEVRWYNETSMRIKSPKNQRNLVVTVFPVTSQRSEE
ncbi:MAG: hypothetical protein AABZ65_02740 [Candidatus Omnitrophota bacterium]